MSSTARLRRRWWRWVALVWVALLAASHLWWWAHPLEVAPAAGRELVELPVVDGQAQLEGTTPLVYRDLDAHDGDAPVAVLLHGSPGNIQDFDALAERLHEGLRVIVPDLPGFGHSKGDLPDYSARAHAHYLLALFDQLGLERAHLVGFSMGGAVAAELADAAPERIASV